MKENGKKTVEKDKYENEEAESEVKGVGKDKAEERWKKQLRRGNIEDNIERTELEEREGERKS